MTNSASTQVYIFEPRKEKDSDKKKSRIDPEETPPLVYPASLSTNSCHSVAFAKNGKNPTPTRSLPLMDAQE